MKTTKILSLVLTLVLLVVGAVCVTASADATPELEIASKNLSYESNISIVFAVKANNTDVAPVLNVYTGDPTEETLTPVTVKAAYTPENSLEKVGYADAYIFFTPGIVAKALETEIYVQAVVTVDSVDYVSEIERYSVVEYCHEMNAKKSTTDYNDIITYGARIQKMLEADGKFSGAYATEYKYVTIKDGTLDGKYDSGIYLEGEKVYPQADGVKAWASSDGKTVMNGDEYVIGASNVSFEEGEAPLTMTYRPGTYGFDDLALGANKPDKSQYGGKDGMGVDGSYTYSIVSDTVFGKTSQVFKATPSQSFKHLTLYTNNTTVSASEATAFEISFDFKVEKDVSTVYNILVDDAGGNCKFWLKFKNSQQPVGIYVWSNSNSTEKATIFEDRLGEYNRIALKAVEKEGKVVLELWANGSYVTDFVTQNGAVTDFTTLYRARVASESSGLNPIYLDNIYIGLVKD